MVEKISKQRQAHLDHIENMTFRNLKIMVRKIRLIILVKKKLCSQIKIKRRTRTWCQL